MPLDCALHGGGTVSDVLSGCDSVLPCHHHVPSESEILKDPACQGSCWLLRDAEAAALGALQP